MRIDSPCKVYLCGVRKLKGVVFTPILVYNLAQTEFNILFFDGIDTIQCYSTKKSNAQEEINNRTNIDPTLDINFRLSESDYRRTDEMITMYCVGTTPVSNVVPIQVTNIFLTLAVNISKILVIYC